MIKKISIFAALFLVTFVASNIFVTRNAGSRTYGAYGIISDIHAGKERVRKNNRFDVVYPRKALGMFQAALNDMKGKVDYVIILGDSVNHSNNEYALAVKKIADNSGLKIIWVKGNHDKNSFSNFSDQNYYYTDINGQRIIVLDDVEQHGSTTGYIDDNQLAWFRSVIQENSIVVAHIPILDKSLNVIPRYQEIYDLINSTHSIAYSGHWHVAWKKDNYEGFPALTNSTYFIRSFNSVLPNNIWVIPTKHSKSFL